MLSSWHIRRRIYISPFLSNRSWVRYSVTNKAGALMGNMSLLCSSARPSWGFISFLACFFFLFSFFVCSCVAIGFPGDPERLQLSQASTWLVDGRLLNINVPMPIARPGHLESWEVTFNPREILFHLMVSLSESKKANVEHWKNLFGFVRPRRFFFKEENGAKKNCKKISWAGQKKKIFRDFSSSSSCPPFLFILFIFLLCVIRRCHWPKLIGFLSAHRHDLQETCIIFFRLLNLFRFFFFYFALTFLSFFLFSWSVWRLKRSSYTSG